MTSLYELVMKLPEERRAEILQLAAEGNGALAAAGFGNGIINSFWNDCVKGEVHNYLRRIGKEANEGGYHNDIYDFYLDNRVGRAPRKLMRELQDALKLAINEDYKPCIMCKRPTNKTVIQQHENRGKDRETWELSEKRMINRGITPSDYSCYSCYQNELVNPKETAQGKRLRA